LRRGPTWLLKAQGCHRWTIDHPTSRDAKEAPAPLKARSRLKLSCKTTPAILARTVFAIVPCFHSPALRHPPRHPPPSPHPFQCNQSGRRSVVVEVSRRDTKHAGLANDVSRRPLLSVLSHPEVISVLLLTRHPPVFAMSECTSRHGERCRRLQTVVSSRRPESSR